MGRFSTLSWPSVSVFLCRSQDQEPYFWLVQLATLTSGTGSEALNSF